MWQQNTKYILFMTLTGFLAPISYALNHNYSHQQAHHYHLTKHYRSRYAHVKYDYHKARQTTAFNYMRGTASYYGDGDGFNGRPMANGHIFNQYNSHYAAHPTLALGTKLKVTNLANGRSIYVTVTDRMPKEGRVIDLSTQAGDYLGMHHRGITQVQLQRISNAFYQSNKDNLEVNSGDDGHQY